MFVTIFLDIYENPWRNNSINPFCLKHPKIIILSKKIVSFFPLIPDCDEKGSKTVFVELLTYTLSVSLTIEIHKNNIDTSRVTNKFLSNETDIFRELLPNTADFFSGKLYQTLLLSDVNSF